MFLQQIHLNGCLNMNPESTHPSAARSAKARGGLTTVEPLLVGFDGAIRLLGYDQLTTLRARQHAFYRFRQKHRIEKQPGGLWAVADLRRAAGIPCASVESPAVNC